MTFGIIPVFTHLKQHLTSTDLIKSYLIKSVKSVKYDVCLFFFFPCRNPNPVYLYKLRDF